MHEGRYTCPRLSKTNMTDKAAGNETEATNEPLNLDGLSGLDFGPNWADKNAKPSRSKLQNNDRKSRHPSGKHPRDRRTEKRGGPGLADKKSDRRGNYSGNRERLPKKSVPITFNPTVGVDLYPQDEAFDALIKRLRSSARTYQLFDLAQLLLEKPERYIVVVSPKDSKGGEKTNLYYSVPGHLPFETEEEAVSYVMKHHIDLFFDVEEIEIDPPKGCFLMVNQCTITGELLGPPNYHRYQEFLQRHFTTRINGMSFERFSSKIESVKEQEQIDAWLESMKKGARYNVKESIESDNKSFDSLESAREFLLKNHKDKVFGSGESIRFAGRDIERLPKGNIRRSVEAYVGQQKHFPLDSANNIRGRLRRQKFAVYKKGTKGVSFVCAVKRKFRDNTSVFTDSIRELIDFIEKHPDIPASKLPKEYIGVDTEKQNPEKLKMTEAEVEAAAKAKSQAKVESEANSEVSSLAADENPTEVANPKEDSPKITEDAQASTEATPKNILSKEEELKLRQLMLDLRWLITEGYVTEYGDGRLFTPPPMPISKPNPRIEEENIKDEVSELQTTITDSNGPELISTNSEPNVIIDETNCEGIDISTNSEAVSQTQEMPIKDTSIDGEK